MYLRFISRAYCHATSFSSTCSSSRLGHVAAHMHAQNVAIGAKSMKPQLQCSLSYAMRLDIGFATSLRLLNLLILMLSGTVTHLHSRSLAEYTGQACRLCISFLSARTQLQQWSALHGPADVEAAAAVGHEVEHVLRDVGRELARQQGALVP